MFRRLHFVFGLWVFAILAPGVQATTLVRLTLDEMVNQATDIVRGKVRDCQGASRGALVVTQCLVNVSERLKGKPAALMTITIPGGKVAGSRTRHVIAGAPELESSQEYLLFLWTGSNGLTQLIGLSQGVLEIRAQNGVVTATRAKIADAGLEDGQGREVTDHGVTVALETIRRKAAALKGAGR